MSSLTVAVIQCPLAGDREENVSRVEHWVREASKRGAQVVVPPELFESRYFPQRQQDTAFALAHPVAGHPTLDRFGALARELAVVLPVSFFERDGQRYFNSAAVFDADGRTLGVYRKSHIPDGPGYTEKYYFRPGSTGFRAFPTRYGCVGVGICWDQWFPEAARCMALLGADVLLYPTAIGNEPEEPEADTAALWRRAMVGHAVSNAAVVAAANRVGKEDDLVFYGTSFVSDQRGDILAELDRSAEGVAVATVDLAEVQRYRASWGFFRDRRPDLYHLLVED